MEFTQPSRQLRLGLSTFARLGEIDLPAGYRLRTFQPGDEDQWLALLATGDFGTWDRSRLNRTLAGERAPLPHTAIFFIEWSDTLVGSACVFLHTGANGHVPELGWVVVHPQHRCRGLGLAVCTAALRYARENGCEYVYLFTETYRHAALRLYQRMGFVVEGVVTESGGEGGRDDTARDSASSYGTRMPADCGRDRSRGFNL